MENNKLKDKMDLLNAYEVIEQTFLSWVGAGLTLIGVGFGVASILAIMKEEHYKKRLIMVFKTIGLLLILVGFLIIILALFQHHKKIRSLADDHDTYAHSTNLVPILGLILSILGIAAFIAILIHLLLPDQV